MFWDSINYCKFLVGIFYFVKKLLEIKFTTNLWNTQWLKFKAKKTISNPNWPWSASILHVMTANFGLSFASNGPDPSLKVNGRDDDEFRPQFASNGPDPSLKVRGRHDDEFRPQFCYTRWVSAAPWPRGGRREICTRFTLPVEIFWVKKKYHKIRRQFQKVETLTIPKWYSTKYNWYIRLRNWAVKIFP